MRKLVLPTAVAASLCFLCFDSLAHAQGTDLTPPPPMQPGQPGQPPVPGQPGRPGQQPPPRNSTEADLQSSEKEDTGLGLEWVYLNANAGYSFIDMKGFSESALAITDTKSSGASFGFAAGVRLLFLTLGLRAQNHAHSNFNLWQINADVGLHMRVSRIDGYLAIRGGYDTVGTLNQSVDVATSGGNASTGSGVDVHGWNVGLAFGLDYYFAHAFSIGAEAAGDVLFLKRPPAPLPAIPAGLPQAQQDAIKAQIANNAALYQSSGSSVGFGGSLTAHVALHF